MGRRVTAIGVAWAAGVTIHVVAACVWSGDPLSLIVQPFLGAVVSAAFVLLALFTGAQASRIRPLRRAWQGHPEFALTLAAGCLALMLVGSAAGLTGEYVDPETNAPFTALHPAAALGAYAGLIFALANWPLGGRSRPRVGTMAKAPVKSPVEVG